MARLRRVARTRGAAPLRRVELSSLNVTSLTQCSASMDLLPYPWVGRAGGWEDPASGESRWSRRPVGGWYPRRVCLRQAVACRCCRQAPGLEARGEDRVPVMVRAERLRAITGWSCCAARAERSRFCVGSDRLEALLHRR